MNKHGDQNLIPKTHVKRVGYSGTCLQERHKHELALLVGLTGQPAELIRLSCKLKTLTQKIKLDSFWGMMLILQADTWPSHEYTHIHTHIHIPTQVNLWTHTTCTQMYTHMHMKTSGELGFLSRRVNIIMLKDLWLSS